MNKNLAAVLAPVFCFAAAAKHVANIGAIFDGSKFRVRRIARAIGVAVVTFRAPAALRSEGVASVGLYPQSVLERTFPVNP